MRKNSRVNPTHITDQKGKRVALENSDPNAQKNVPDLRDRVSVIERIIGIRDSI